MTAILLLLLTPSIAQLSRNLRFEAITINDGLSQGMVNCIIQDHYGFMWFATNDGLNQFDGYNFTIFKNDGDNQNTLAANFLRYLFEDSKGRIWIGTANSGLDMFDRDTESFIHFKHLPDNENSLSDNSITSISEDKAGDLWVGTLSGLNRIHIQPKKVLNENNPKTKSATEDFFKRNEVRFTKIIFDRSQPGFEFFRQKKDFPLGDWRSSNFFIDQKGAVWVSAYQCLFRVHLSENGSYSVEKLQVSDYIQPKESDKRDRGLENFVQVFIAKPSSDKFYLLCEYGITEVDARTNKIRFLSQKRYKSGVFNFLSVIDGNGVIWTSEDSKLNYWDTREQKFTVPNTYNNSIANSLNYVCCSYCDQSGNVWIGTKGYGLLKYNPRSERFHSTGNQNINLLSSGIDNKILVLRQPWDELFYVYDPVTNSEKNPVSKSGFAHLGITEHYGYQTRSVLQDADSSYWIGRVGLYHYIPKSGKMSCYWKNFDDIFPLYDDRKGNLWFGNTNGLVCYNKKNNDSQEYPFPVKSTMGPYDFCQAIYRGENGLLWLGTLQGLYSFDPSTKGWQHYRNMPGDTTSLSNDLIFCIVSDPIHPEEVLWIGTKGGGLNKFDLTTTKFKRYSTKDGLPNDVIYGIVSDVDGNLWMSTNKGISRFSISHNSFTNYEEKDGLQGNEFNRNAFCKIGTSTLCFGGLNGFNYFYPKELNGNQLIPNTLITRIGINNQPATLTDNYAVLKKPSYLTDRIELNYNQNVFNLEFSSLDFNSLKNKQYQYKLDGYDTDWINSGSRNTATYTNMDPGSYTFKVKGSNDVGDWNKSPTILLIKVLAPWYMTWWFRIFAFLVTISGLYALYRYRVKTILAMQEVRNNIASDLHDNIGSNLSAISIFTDIADNPQKSKSEVTELLKKIANYTLVSQEAMSEIVWMINSRHDRLDQLVNRMQGFSGELLDSKGIDLQFYINENTDSVILNMKQRKSVYLLFKEAITNISKYADASLVKVQIYRVKKMLILEIADNGIGFDLDEVSNKITMGGNGLPNMQRRAKELRGTLSIDTSKGKGTAIYLQFSI